VQKREDERYRQLAAAGVSLSGSTPATLPTDQEK
jgi:hypothetical protein